MWIKYTRHECVVQNELQMLSSLGHFFAEFDGQLVGSDLEVFLHSD